jgi:hypothetical protein
MPGSFSRVLVSILAAAPARRGARAPGLARRAFDALGEVSRGGTGSGGGAAARTFIVAETAVALALLGGGISPALGAIVRDNGSMVIDGVLTLELTTDENRFPADADVATFYREALPVGRGAGVRRPQRSTSCRE